VSKFDSRPSFARRVAWVDANEPVSVAEVKAQSRIVFDDEDALLLGYVSAVRERCENELNRKIRRQTVELTYSGFGTGLRLDGLGHDVEVVSVEYVDAAGAFVTMQASEYRVQKGQVFKVVPVLDWPVLSLSKPEVLVTVDAGYVSAAEVPSAVKQWIVANVASMYRAREAHSEKPMNELQFVCGLLDPYRITIV
jgi:uncharacterized phiE125 gp8 family phage protein